MFELTELPKEKVRILGKEYEVDKPNVAQVISLQEQLKASESNPSETFKVMCRWISDCGIEIDAVKKLKLNQLTSLVEHLSDSKKN